MSILRCVLFSNPNVPCGGKMYKQTLIIGLVIAALGIAPVHAQEGQNVAAAAVTKATFNLNVNPAVLNCLLQPSKSKNPPQPSATVTVTEGNLNDTLVINLKHFKPGLA